MIRQAYLRLRHSTQSLPRKRGTPTRYSARDLQSMRDCCFAPSEFPHSVHIRAASRKASEFRIYAVLFTCDNILSGHKTPRPGKVGTDLLSFSQLTPNFSWVKPNPPSSNRFNDFPH
jgi:hypothetical protein